MKTYSSLFLLFFVSLSVFAQDITVRGKVTDSQLSEPIVGATVLLEGTTIGQTTNLDGNFSISVPPNGILTFSFIGYKSKSIPINERRELNVTLEEDMFTTEEVVVVGYGGQKRSSLSTSISTVKVGDEIKSQPTSLFSALQGQIPGVTISKNGGDPLSGLNIVIRGQGSRKGDPVLFVVDGVPGAPYNEQDVESVTVLKDAAAAAIYGANVGSGGVILITTKKAKEGKVVVTAKVQTGIQQAVNLPTVLTAEQYNKVRTDAFAADGRPAPLGCDPNLYAFGQTTRTDWVNEIFRTGSMQNYAISLSGGSDKLRGLASFEYNKVEGTLHNTYARNIGIISSLDFQLSKQVSFSQKLSYKYSDGQGGVSNGGHTGIIASAMFYPRSATVYEQDKEGNYVLDGNGNKTFGGTVPLWAKDLGVAGTFGEIQNPVASLHRMAQKRPSNSLYSTSTITIKPLEYFTIKSDFTANGYFNRNEEFNYRKPEIGKPDLNNSRRIDNSLGYGYLSETVFIYEQYLKNHHLSAMAGASFKYNQGRSNSTTVKTFPNEDSNSQHFINGTNWSDIKPGEGFGEEATTGFFARGSYSYDDRYFAVASVRRDASSKLYNKNNSGIFPAFSTAWKVSSEEFFKNFKAISTLKLRASWGRVGNVSSVGNYSYIVSLASSGGAYFGNDGQTIVNGAGLTTIPNLNLKWESAEQTNIGVDLAFLSNRLNVTADYYVKNTRDLIDELTMSSVSGISSPPAANVGRVENRGWEFSATYADQTRFGLTYAISANTTLLKNEVKDIGLRDYFPHNDGVRGLWTMRSAVGQPWYSYYLVQTAGLFQTDQEAKDYVDKKGKMIQPNAKAGDLKFIDQDGDGIISDEDRVYMGSYSPKFTYGISTNLAYKGFDLSLQFQGVSGVKIFNGAKKMGFEYSQGWNLSTLTLDSWNYNHSSSTPRVTVSDLNSNFTTASDFFLEDGSYCRLKNLTVGYTLPTRLLGALNTMKARIYFSGENLFTITNYSGMDPEVGGNGIDGGTYPVSRILSIGLNITF